MNGKRESKDGTLSVKSAEEKEERVREERTGHVQFIYLPFDKGRQITGAPITTVDPIVFYFYESNQHKSERDEGWPY